MNKLGIIGGMGPLATNIFYRRIIDSTLANKDQDHIYTIISSHSTMPDRTSVILNNKSHEEVLKAVKEDLEIMEVAKVSNIAIPCNTFHYFYDEVQKLTSIPIINMVEETLKVFKDKVGNKVIVLCTLGTKKAKVYEKYASELGIQVVELEDKYSQILNDIVYQIKSTNIVEKPEFIDLLYELSKTYKPNGFILACTELSLVPLENYKKNNIIDAMDVLVRESIIKSGYSLERGE